MSIQRSVFKVVGVLIQQLFKAEDRRLQREIDEIVEQNNQLGKNRADWFMYQGAVYTSSKSIMIPSGAGSYPQLAMGLMRTMDSYTRDKAEVERDKTQIKQILFTLLQSCMNKQEIRDTLPASLVSLVPELSELPPRFAEGYLAPKHERFVSQYAKILPKIEFYCGTRLLY